MTMFFIVNYDYGFDKGKLYFPFVIKQATYSSLADTDSVPHTALL